MALFTAPRLVISGATRRAGTSLMTFALALAFKKRGLSVSVCMQNLQLGRAALYYRTTKRYVRFLDSYLLSPEERLQSIIHAGIGADLLLIEGKEALFDGEEAGSIRGSDAEIALMAQAPVALVVDTRVAQNTLGVFVKGIGEAAALYPPGFTLAGTLCNYTALGELDEDRYFYEVALSAFGVPSPIGLFPYREWLREYPWAGRSPSQQESPLLLPRNFLLELIALVEERISLDTLLERASKVPVLRTEENDRPLPRRVRIAVSDDLCFALSLQDNLDLLRYFGAELVPFSPLADATLPARIGGVYVTGAYLGEYGKEVSENESMRKALLQFVERGGVLFSEGAGTAYLCESFVGKSGEVLPGVGVLGARAVPCRQPFSYVQGVTTESTILGDPDLFLRGIDTGDWEFEGAVRAVSPLSLTRVGTLQELKAYSPGSQVLGSFAFFHFGANVLAAKNLVDAAFERYPLSKGSGEK